MKNKKIKWFFTGILSLLLIFGFIAAGCDNSTSPSGNSGENNNNGNNNGGNNNGGGDGGGTQTGLYMGILGFNDDVFGKEIGLLNASTKNSYTSFVTGMVMKNNTALYHAVNTAMDRIEKATLPNDLINVSIITFTDGLDNISHRLNSSYPGEGEYQNAINKRINALTINGIPIYAYTIGLTGKTGGGGTDVMGASLGSISSTPSSKYVKMSSDMDKINEEFELIAESLYKENKSQSISIEYPPPIFGTRVRFTFDNVNKDTMQNSKLYIEGIYSTDDILTDIHYEGFNSSSGVSVQARPVSGSNAWVLAFKDFSLKSGGDVSLSYLTMWRRGASASDWIEEDEFKRDAATVTEVEEKSTVIMLVLDCSNSLGATDFTKLKTSANNFIDVLIRGSQNSNTTSYTVTFNSNGGSGTVSSMTANAGSSITLPGGSGLSRSGYTFGGWNTNSSGTGTNYNAGASFTVNANTTLYAKWNSSGGEDYYVFLDHFTSGVGNGGTQQGWATNGYEGKYNTGLDIEDLIKAENLIVWMSGKPTGGLQLIWQGTGPGVSPTDWNQTEILNNKGEADFSKGSYITQDGALVIELSIALKDYNKFVTLTGGKILLGYYSNTVDDLMITNACFVCN